MIKARYDKRLQYKPLDLRSALTENDSPSIDCQEALALIPSPITDVDTINVEIIRQL